MTASSADRPDRDAPIGILDCGFGGLTVARAVIDQLPGEDVIFLGDSARAPYGPLPVGQVREYALECCDRLVEQGIKLLVIACNSASAAIMADARERYPVPVVEVIRPAARRAAAVSRTGRIGVLCTRATATARAYEDAFAVAGHLEVTTAVCHRFVEFVEAGITTGDELVAVAREYLAPIIAADADTVVLGCTHYPLLSGAISYVLGGGVTLVSSADACADRVWAELTDQGLTRPTDGVPGRHRFLTTGSSDAFLTLGRRLLGDWIVEVDQLW